MRMELRENVACSKLSHKDARANCICSLLQDHSVKRYYFFFSHCPVIFPYMDISSFLSFSRDLSRNRTTRFLLGWYIETMIFRFSVSIFQETALLTNVCCYAASIPRFNAKFSKKNHFFPEKRLTSTLCVNFFVFSTTTTRRASCPNAIIKLYSWETLTEC